jgi:hypothetical protein
MFINTVMIYKTTDANQIDIERIPRGIPRIKTTRPVIMVSISTFPLKCYHL